MSISGAAIQFLSPLAYVVGEIAEMEICLDPTTYIRPIARIVAEERCARGAHAYLAEFSFISPKDHEILTGTLLALRRKELEKDYAPTDWSSLRK